MKGRKAKPVAVLPMYQGWEPPAHLSAGTASEFSRVVELLRQRGTLEFVDSRLIARRSEVNELAETAYGAVRKDGAFERTDRGNLCATRPPRSCKMPPRCSG